MHKLFYNFFIWFCYVSFHIQNEYLFSHDSCDVLDGWLVGRSVVRSVAYGVVRWVCWFYSYPIPVIIQPLVVGDPFAPFSIQHVHSLHFPIISFFFYAKIDKKLFTTLCRPRQPHCTITRWKGRGSCTTYDTLASLTNPLFKFNIYLKNIFLFIFSRFNIHSFLCSWQQHPQQGKRHQEQTNDQCVTGWKSTRRWTENHLPPCML